MNAREHLSRLVDALGRAGAQRIKGAPARPVDPGEPKDVHRRAMLPAEIEPARFGRNAPLAPLAGGAQLRSLIHQIAAAVAVNTGRRQIAEPAQLRQRGYVVMVPVEHRIALRIRRHRDQDVSYAGESLGIERVLAIEATAV